MSSNYEMSPTDAAWSLLISTLISLPFSTIMTMPNPVRPAAVFPLGQGVGGLGGVGQVGAGRRAGPSGGRHLERVACQAVGAGAQLPQAPDRCVVLPGRDVPAYRGTPACAPVSPRMKLLVLPCVVPAVGRGAESVDGVLHRGAVLLLQPHLLLHTVIARHIRALTGTFGTALLNIALDCTAPALLCTLGIMRLADRMPMGPLLLATLGLWPICVLLARARSNMQEEGGKV